MSFIPDNINVKSLDIFKHLINVTEKYTRNAFKDLDIYIHSLTHSLTHSLHSMSSRSMTTGYTTSPIDLVLHAAFQLDDVLP